MASTFMVTIEEIVAGTYAIEADTAEETAHIVRRRYLDGQLVLEPGEVQAVRLCVHEPDGQATKWERL